MMKGIKDLEFPYRELRGYQFLAFETTNRVFFARSQKIRKRSCFFHCTMTCGFTDVYVKKIKYHVISSNQRLESIGNLTKYVVESNELCFLHIMITIG